MRTSQTMNALRGSYAVMPTKAPGLRPRKGETMDIVDEIVALRASNVLRSPICEIERPDCCSMTSGLACP